MRSSIFFALINKNLPKSSIGIDQPFFWGDFSFILLFAVTGFPEFPGFPDFTGFSGYSCFPASLASSVSPAFLTTLPGLLVRAEYGRETHQFFLR